MAGQRARGAVTLGPVALAALEAARAAEREQTLYYRALAGLAENADQADTAERINGMLADEQHHYSRLSARMMEAGHVPPEGTGAGNRPQSLENWEAVARERERDEIVRYEALLRLDLDTRTQIMVEEILASERRHARELGGKWMGA